MKAMRNYCQITATVIFLLSKPALYATPPLEAKTGPLPELLDYVMRGITNKALFLSLEDKQEPKYLLVVTAYSGQRETTNSPVLYMPWRLLQKVGTSNSFKLAGAGSYAEFTMSVTNGNTRQKYGMPGSGFPRGSTNWLAAMEIQLWANRELGDCEDIYHLHPESGDTNFTLLTAKAGGKWVILESRRNPQYVGYYDRGDNSYTPGSRNDPHRTPPANAPKPMVFDEASKFEDFYGRTEVLSTKLGKVRLWRKGELIIWHIDDTPKSLLVVVEKASGAEFNEREVFEIRERFCGIQDWSLEEKGERLSSYSTKDHKFRLNWLYKDFDNLKIGDSPRQRIQIEYLLVSTDLKKL
jgi:hypothetical protein